MNPSTFTTTPSTLTLDGVALDDDESSVEGAVLEGPGEAVLVGVGVGGLGGDAVLKGPAQPLSDSEPVADSHGTRGSARREFGCRPIPNRVRQRH